MFKKLLIANRGEIALRILRACKELNIATVAVHSSADADAMHVRCADESVCIGPASAQQSYLNMANIISAAEITGAQAIHPGFGFLSENALFAEMVQAHELVFVGPRPEHLRIMGHKTLAKAKAKELGLPVVLGSDGELESVDQALTLAQGNYPILLKASAGGGGKGMRVVQSEHEMREFFDQAQSEAKANFGHDGVYLEKYLSHPRHIEFQVMGDRYGHVVCLGDRDCSLQRRHQKIWEEAPCAALPWEMRQSMMKRVVDAMENLGYENAGTLEFLYQDGEFYFIEMNTRIQVEHPVTEMITGLDLVKEQIRVAAGLPLSFSAADVNLRGHAIECRINAENPKTFLPSPGQVTLYSAPGGPCVRVDSALFHGYKIPPFYDSLIAKLVVHGRDRAECLARLRRALDEYVIAGVDTLIPLHQKLCRDADVQAGDYHVKWLETVFLPQQQAIKDMEI